MKSLAQLYSMKLELVEKLENYKNYSANDIFKKNFISKKIEEVRYQIKKVTNEIWRVNNRDKINARVRELRRQNPEKYRAWSRNWRANSPTRKAYEREYHRNLRHASVQKMWENKIRTMTKEHYCAVKNVPYGKRYGLIGLTSEEFRTYIRSKWEPWMDDTNYGRVTGGDQPVWNFHHVKPLSSFDLTKPKQRKLAAHWSNVMPINGVTNTQLGRCR